MLTRWHLQTLEDRTTPAGTVTASQVGSTWTLTGDADANDITINPTLTPGTFALLGNATTVAGVTTPAGITNIVVNLFDGDDAVRFNDLGNPAVLSGNLTVKGGNGGNFVDIDDLIIGGNLTITNGVNTAATDRLDLTNTIVAGKATINNGAGDTETYFTATQTTGFYVGKAFTLTNGAGRDFVDISDYHFGNNVTIKNGTPDLANDAGYCWFYNNLNTLSRSVIKGNLLVNYTSGVVDSNNGIGLWDYEMLGNATIQFGAGGGQIYADGFTVNAPTMIQGNFTITGKTDTILNVGYQTYQDAGLIVGKNFTMTTGAGADAIVALQLRVNGTTKISMGAGNDFVQMEDSVFGNFTLLMGTGNDDLILESDDTLPSTTQFLRTTKIDMGGDNDTVAAGIVDDGTRRVELFGNTSILGNTGTDNLVTDNVVLLLPGLLSVVA